MLRSWRDSSVRSAPPVRCSGPSAGSCSPGSRCWREPRRASFSRSPVTAASRRRCSHRRDGPRPGGDRGCDLHALAGGRPPGRARRRAVQAAARLQRREPILRRSRRGGRARQAASALRRVLGAAALALAWQAFRGREVHALPAVVAYPAAAFIAIAAVSLTWTSQLDAGANTLAYFILPFATLLAVAGRAPFPPGCRALAIVAVSLAGSSLRSASRRQRTTSCSSRRASRSATPSAPFFRVTSLFRDPSLYGRHVVLGIAVLLVALLRRRINVFVAAALIAFLRRAVLLLLAVELRRALRRHDRTRPGRGRPPAADRRDRDQRRCSAARAT